MDQKYSIIIVLLITLALYIPTLGYPLTDDSLHYALNAMYYSSPDLNLMEQSLLNLDLKRPPMFSLMSMPLTFLGFSPALKLTALLLGLVSIIAWYFIGKELFNDWLFPLMILSPLLILYTTFTALSESALIAFSLLSVLFFLKAKKESKYYYLSGLFLGLASLSRYEGIIIGLGFISYFLIKLKKPSKHFLLSLLLAALVFSPLLIFNYINTGSPLPPDYVERFLGQSSEGPYSLHPLKGPLAFLYLFPLALLISGPLFIPHFINSLRRPRKNSLFLSIIILFIISISFTIGFYSFLERIRYLVPAIPFILLLSFSGLGKSPILRKLLILGIILNILAIPLVVNGQVKFYTDSIHPTPTTWGQVGFANQKTIEWINQNIPENANLLHRHRILWREYLRPDITQYHPLNTTPITGDFYLLEDEEMEQALRERYFVGPNGVESFWQAQAPEDYITLNEYLETRYNSEELYNHLGVRVLVMVEK